MSAGVVISSESSPAIGASGRSRHTLYGIALVVLVTLAYSATWRAGFIWDDDMHVTANPVIVGPQGLGDIWTTASANYFPLTLTTFWLLHALFGLDPTPYHLANVALQAACALVLWRVLLRLRIPGAWLAAALWALHPVQVESVAWISELKNTQACLFFLLAIRSFLQWLADDSPRWRARHYAALLLFTACAYLSKASTVMLPVALLLGAWWQTGRVTVRHLVAILPVLLFSAAASAWTIWEQKYHSYALGPEWNQTLGERIVIAGRAVWFYLGKLLWPHPLMFIYPRWQPSAAPLAFVPFLAVLAFTIALVVLLPRTRGLLVAALFFGALLFPVLGFFNVYFFRYSFVADHFQHLASIGPLTVAAVGLTQLHGYLAARVGRVALLLPAVILLTLTVLTWRETRVYQDSSTLWHTAYARNPAAWMAATILGNEATEAGRPEEGLRLHDTALRVHPDAFEVHYNRGLALKKLGRIDEAIAAYQRALALKQNFPEAEHNLAVAYLAANRGADAVRHFRRSLALKPQPETHHYLALTLAATGQPADAIAHFQSAVRLRPEYADAHAQLARLLHTQGHPEEALSHFRRAVALKPSDTETRRAFANALALSAIAHINAGRLPEANRQLNEALAIQPDFAEGCFHVASALAQNNHAEAAVEIYRHALRLKPDYPEAHYNLALLLQALGQRDAAKHAAEARRLRPELPPLP